MYEVNYPGSMPNAESAGILYHRIGCMLTAHAYPTSYVGRAAYAVSMLYPHTKSLFM